MVLCLIVDDDEIVCSIAADSLISWGFKVMVKHNGLDALTWCAGRMPDFIILDMKMPNVDGLTFMSTLHKMSNGKKPKVIASTGLRDPETVIKLRDIGISAYLVKPYNMAALKDKLTKLDAFSFNLIQ
jgi:DNA-binding response OmpR family regulator